jgi:transcription antitermination factor NusG
MTQAMHEKCDLKGGSVSYGAIMDFGNRLWPWYAILTRAGSEKFVTLQLENAGYECYLPMGRYPQRLGNRTRELEVLFMPGCLFCRMNSRDRLTVLTTPGVIQIVGVGSSLVPIHESEIAAIRRVEKSLLPTTPWPFMQAGQRAEIVDGPLKGLTGIVVESKSATKLVLSIEILERSIAVEVDEKWIRETDDEGALARRTSARSKSIPIHAVSFEEERSALRRG